MKPKQIDSERFLNELSMTADQFRTNSNWDDFTLREKAIIELVFHKLHNCLDVSVLESKD